MNIIGIILSICGALFCLFLLICMMKSTYDGDSRSEKIELAKAFAISASATGVIFIATFWITFLYNPPIYSASYDIYIEDKKTESRTQKSVSYKAVCQAKVWTDISFTGGLDHTFKGNFDKPCRDIPNDVAEWIKKREAYFK